MLVLHNVVNNHKVHQQYVDAVSTVSVGNAQQLDLWSDSHSALDRCHAWYVLSTALLILAERNKQHLLWKF